MAGVSPTTVSHALNRPSLVSRETRDRVLQAIQATGYVADLAARRMRGMLSQLVGVLVVDVSNPFFAEVLRGVEEELRSADCLPMTCSSDVEPERQARYLALLRAQRPRGLILHPVGHDLEDIARTVSADVPVVLLDHPAGELPVCAVTVDHRLGGRLAAEHLLGLGHRRLAVVSSVKEVAGVRERMAGFRDAVQAAGLDPADAVATFIFHDVRPEPAVQDVLRALRRRRTAPTAVFCLNDTAAIVLLKELSGAGIDVPGRVSVVGYDDLTVAEIISPPLTTVRQHAQALGRAAAQLLLSESEPDHVHREHAFRPQLIVRASTAVPPG